MAGRGIAFLAVLAAVLPTGLPAWAQRAVDLAAGAGRRCIGQRQPGALRASATRYVAAFRDPRLLQAVRSGATGSIAVTMTQWTGPAMQVQVVPWALIADQASMLAFADAIEKAPRQLFGGGTSISGAIDHAMALFAKSDHKGARRVIDISGDGANNRGRRSGGRARRGRAGRRRHQRPADSRGWSPFSTSTTGPM